MLRSISLGSDFSDLGKVTDAGFLDRARSEFVGSLQLSEPRGILAEGLKPALAEVFRTYVAEKREATAAQASLAPSRLRQQLWSAFSKGRLFRTGSKETGVKKNFVVEGQHASWTFDVGYRNGALSLINSVALNSEKTETNLNRALVLQGMAQEVRKADTLARFAAVVSAPGSMKGHGINEAVDILTDSNIEIVPTAEIGKLVQRVRMQLNLIE
jgi:hypothetical protein